MKKTEVQVAVMGTAWGVVETGNVTNVLKYIPIVSDRSRGVLICFLNKHNFTVGNKSSFNFDLP